MWPSHSLAVPRSQGIHQDSPPTATEMSRIAPLIWHTEPQGQPTLDRTLQKGLGEDRTFQKGLREPPARALPSLLRQEPAWSPHTSFM